MGEEECRRPGEGGREGSPETSHPTPSTETVTPGPSRSKSRGRGVGGQLKSQDGVKDHKLKKKKRKKVHSNVKKRPGHSSGHENSADSTRPCPQSGHSNNKVPGQQGVHHTRPTARGDCPHPPPPIQLPTDLPAIRAGHSGTPSAPRCVASLPAAYIPSPAVAASAMRARVASSPRTSSSI